MARGTPFHERTAALNETLLWEHWAGYAVAKRYQYSLNFEYYAVRNSVGLFDTSPLFKYRITGADAENFLSRVFTRDVRRCGVGRAQYTIWCDEAGHVLEDGVVLRLTENEYLLSSAGPNLLYLSGLGEGFDVAIEDITEDYGMLALQGPHAGNVIAGMGLPTDLPYFSVGEYETAGHRFVLSRTGYSGDLGYELWVSSKEALEVWDAVVAAGEPFSLLPYGMDALNMTRTEAGLVQLNVDFESARHAWIDADRETPIELGFEWMLRGLAGDDRDFIGREAIETEIEEESSRWKTVGFEVDVESYEELYNDLGLIAPKDGVLSVDIKSLYSGVWEEHDPSDWVGYATTFMYSPILKRHIGLAKLETERTEPGSIAYLELVVAHRPRYVLVRVANTPFFEPERKTGEVVLAP